MRTIPCSNVASVLLASTSNGRVTVRWNCPDNSSWAYQVAFLPWSLSATFGTEPESVNVFWV